MFSICEDWMWCSKIIGGENDIMDNIHNNGLPMFYY
jgi:hypothetical protein